MKYVRVTVLSTILIAVAFWYTLTIIKSTFTWQVSLIYRS